jgi:L-iditol 2-dehydrogenase
MPALPGRASQSLRGPTVDRHARRRRLRRPGSSCRRRTCTRCRPTSTRRRRRRSSRWPASATRCSSAPSSRRATRCSSSAREQVGLLAAQAARAAGAHVHVRGTARDEARLELADRLGFATSAAGGARDDGYPGEAADVVVECSGSPAGIATGLTAARRGGRLVQMGLHGGPVELPYDLICFHELVVTAGFASTTASWRRALTLVEGGAVELRPLLTAVLPLEEWERAFAASRQADGVKYALVPG